jgi:hypothetical protein
MLLAPAVPEDWGRQGGYTKQRGRILLLWPEQVLGAAHVEGDAEQVQVGLITCQALNRAGNFGGSNF